MEKSITLTDRTQKKRIEWIDIAKGIGMVLVMLGHAQIPYVSPCQVAYASEYSEDSALSN